MALLPGKKKIGGNNEVSYYQGGHKAEGGCLLEVCANSRVGAYYFPNIFSKPGHFKRKKKQGMTSSFRFNKTKQSAKSNKQCKRSLTSISKPNFGTQLTSCLGSMFFVWKGWDGNLFYGGHLLSFWTFRVGAYLKVGS